MLNMHRKPNANPINGEVTIGSSNLSGHALEVDHMIAGLGDARADQAADQGMGGTGGNAVVPGDQIPDDGRKQSAENYTLGDAFGGDNALADGAGDVGAHEGPGDIEHAGVEDGGARGQHLGRNHGGDGVGGIVEAVDVFKNQRRRDNKEKQGQNHLFTSFFP